MLKVKVKSLESQVEQLKRASVDIQAQVSWNLKLVQYTFVNVITYFQF